MLLSRYWCKLIMKTIKFSMKSTIKFTIFCGYLIFLMGLQIYNLIKWTYNISFYRKHGFTYLQLYKKINLMTGRQFEIFMYYLFKTNNYKAQLTKSTCDGGKDLIVWINREKTYIELKRWNYNHKVGREILQKLVGASVGDNANRCICITTGEYNNNAIEYSKKINNLELWNIEDILKLCKSAEDKMHYILSKCEIITNKDIFHRINNFNIKIENNNNKLERKLRKMEFKNRYN